jgi:hypothetical protein
MSQAAHFLGAPSSKLDSSRKMAGPRFNPFGNLIGVVAFVGLDPRHNLVDLRRLWIPKGGKGKYPLAEQEALS